MIYKHKMKLVDFLSSTIKDKILMDTQKKIPPDILNMVQIIKISILLEHFLLLISFGEFLKANSRYWFPC